MGAAWLKMGGGLIYFLFLCPKRGGVLERDLKERGAKYRNYSTSIPSSSFSNMLQERGETAGVKAWIARLMYCMLCTW
jgi:hypothetical protein